jgi:hypothetical protein
VAALLFYLIAPGGAARIPARYARSVACAPTRPYREGLALARRAGLSWFQAEPAACEAALKVAPNKTERSEWACVLDDTRTTWMRAYERRPTGCTL